MDISRFNTADPSEDGSWMDILDWDMVTKIGAQVLVYGPDSMSAAKIADEEEKFAQKRIAETWSKKPGDKDAEDEETSTERAVRKAVRITKDWKNLQWGESDFVFSSENAETLYRKSPHIRNQVLEFYRDRSNFTKSK